MSSELPLEWPDLPRVRPGIFVYQAPAPVRLTIEGLEILLGKRDTITIEFNTDRPMGVDICFDWNVDESPLAARYKANERYGDVNVWYERQGS